MVDDDHGRQTTAARVDLVWVNSPSNPTGRVLGVEHLRKVVQWGRERGALVVSDECYVELEWDVQPVSLLHPDVCEGRTDRVLVLHSVSKRSNMAGYRAGFVAGDQVLIDSLLAPFPNNNFSPPTPGRWRQKNSRPSSPRSARAIP